MTRLRFIAIMGLIAAALGGWAEPDLTLQGWLFAWHVFMAISLGSLGFIMLLDVTGGEWGVPTLPLFRAAARVIPWLALLFIVPMLGVYELYPWAREPAIHNRAWLNPPFWIGRSIAYLVIWSWAGLALARPHPSKVGAPGLAVFVFTVSFAAIDWGMSLEPDWFSTVYGLFYVLGDAVSALAFIILVLVTRGRREHPQYRALGGLLLAFLMLLTYVQFGQWVIVWSANLPEEITWYHHRIDHGWGGLALGMLMGGLFAPFLALLFASNKQQPRRLGLIAGVVSATMVCQFFWWLVPAGRPVFTVAWTDVVCLLAIGGAWTVLYLEQLAKEAA